MPLEGKLEGKRKEAILNVCTCIRSRWEFMGSCCLTNVT
jgi:hypothetical protein